MSHIVELPLCCDIGVHLRLVYFHNSKVCAISGRGFGRFFIEHLGPSEEILDVLCLAHEQALCSFFDLYANGIVNLSKVLE